MIFDVRFLWRIVQGLFKIALKIWPLWVLIGLRALGGDIWPPLVRAVWPSMSNSLYTAGYWLSVTLAPGLVVIPAEIAVATGWRPKSDTNIAALAILISGAWTLLEAFWYEIATYPGYSVSAYVESVSPAVYVVAVICGAIAARALRVTGRPGSPKSAGTILGFFGRTPKIPRAVGGVHGDADFISIDRAKKIFSHGGIALGEAYRVDLDPSIPTERDGVRRVQVAFDPRDRSTWGRQAGKADILRFDGRTGSGHVMAFVGSGGYKTTGTAVPSALAWDGALVILDPAREIFPQVAPYRESLGRTAVVLDPYNSATGTIDVLGWIDTSTDRAVLQAMEVVLWLDAEQPGGGGGDSMFRDYARLTLQCLLLIVLFGPAERRNLAELRRLVCLPEGQLRGLLEAVISKGETFAFGALTNLATRILALIKVDRTWQGVSANATTVTAWLDVPSLARLVSGGPGSVPLAALPEGRTDFYVCIDDKTLKSAPGAGRAILAALAGAMQKAADAETLNGGRALFLLDEVYQLGKMEILASLRDLGRKWGIVMILLFQSIGQMREVWGRDGATSWLSSTQIQLFACVGDDETAKIVSEACGKFTALAEGTSDSAGTGRQGMALVGHSNRSAGTTEQQVERDVIQPDEVRRMRADEEILIVKELGAIRCGRAIGFRRPAMAAVLGENRYAPKG